LVLILRRPITSCGHLSSMLQEGDSLTRDIPSKEEEIGETDNNLSINWFNT